MDDDWAIPIIYYYHRLYIKTVQEYLIILYEEKQYDELVAVAYSAIRIDELDETIQYYLILVLYHLVNVQAALSQYEYFIKLLYNNYGINPNDNLKNLYKEIIKSEKSPQLDLNIIKEDLRDKVSYPKAYECEFVIFQHIYQIQSHSMVRTGLTFFLCLLTITSENTVSHSNMIAQAMDRMSNILCHSLRSGDVYSRYSKNQYIALLSSTSFENSTLVGERILRNFDNVKPKLHVTVSYRLCNMEPHEF